MYGAARVKQSERSEQQEEEIKIEINVVYQERSVGVSRERERKV